MKYLPVLNSVLLILLAILVATTRVRVNNTEKALLIQNKINEVQNGVNQLIKSFLEEPVFDSLENGDKNEADKV